MKTIEITKKKIDFSKVYQQMQLEGVGAICIFSGNVRQGDKKERLLYIFYDVYKKAALKELEKIIEEIKKQFPIKKILVIHRVGKVLPEEASLLVAVGTGHRKEGFSACQRLVEKIKEKVPIWKKEVFENQLEQWI